MDSATDTDSEADHLAVAPYPTRMALSPSFASPPAYKSSKLKDVHAALQELCTVETSLLVKDITYANNIQRACMALVCAVRELSIPDSNNRDGLMEVFKEITSEHFLAKLLAYRREFLYVGVLSASLKGALVSWVDVILANIAMTSVCIASDTAGVDGMKHTLAGREEDEAIRAASQLPYTWPEMLDLLTSNIASCTVLRLSLRLTFAAYVIHPQLSGMQSRAVRVDSTNRFTPSWLTKVTRTYLSRIFPTDSVVPEYNGDDSFEWSPRDRTVFAMILVLFSVAKETNHSIVQTPCKFPYVFPLEVLCLIRAIIYPDPRVTLGSALFPFARPDGAQIVLLCWGQVAPWSWAIWNDTRFADMELITQLTAVWICHADTLRLRMRCMRHHNWQRLLLRASETSSSDASFVITELLHNVTLSSLHDPGKTSTMWSNLLLRTCWWTAQLIDLLYSCRMHDWKHVLRGPRSAH
ncbi:hypothetical protein DFH94DRAFT_738363 [Russula ochroleuca]|uniref:Uncharacterized protein n=1 Tax=Russula ochroleuca TaxID=152965 RepID=A0A9P5MXF4_9AGAM|nr:hypothetical protein DFH94DRAFT_738363 [Russula ochroleuca]